MMTLEGVLRGRIVGVKVDDNGDLFVCIDGDLKDYEGNQNLVEIRNTKALFKKNIENKEEKTDNKQSSSFSFYFSSSSSASSSSSPIFLSYAKDSFVKLDANVKEHLSFFVNHHCVITLEFSGVSLSVDSADLSECTMTDFMIVTTIEFTD